MNDVRYLKQFLKNMKEDIEYDVSSEMVDFQEDFGDLIGELQDERQYRTQIKQIITDLDEALSGKIEDTIENLDDPDLISENIDRIYDIMKMVRDNIQRFLKEIHAEFESGEFPDQRVAEELLDFLKGINKNFNEIFEDFEDAYYNDELTMDM